MIEELHIWLLTLSDHPFLVCVILALSTLLTEDGALITGSLLVGSQLFAAEAIVISLIAGIAARARVLEISAPKVKRSRSRAG